MRNKISNRQMLIHTALAVAGMVIWIVMTLITGKDEPWDSDQFWSYGLFLMVTINIIAAVLDPHQPVIKGLISVVLQPIAMMFVAGEIGSMFPLGLIVFAVLGIIYSIGGVIGVKIRQRFFQNISENL